MRTLYIVDRDVALANMAKFAVRHFIDLPNGQVLLSVEYGVDEHQTKFERNSSADPLPAEDDPTPIRDQHAQKLANLGVKKGHTTKDVRAIAKQSHKLM